MDHKTYRRTLSDIIAAAYRVLETWEVCDLTGRVTILGETARQWDAALGLEVAARRGDGTRVKRRRHIMSDDTAAVASTGIRAWALHGLDDAVAAALRLDDYLAARACADVALFIHVLVAASLPPSPALDALLATLEERVQRLTVHRDALDPAMWSYRQEVETYTRRLERRVPDGPLLAAQLRRRYAALYGLLPRLLPDEDLPDHADASMVENLITELKDALGIA